MNSPRGEEDDFVSSPTTSPGCSSEFMCVPDPRTQKIIKDKPTRVVMTKGKDMSVDSDQEQELLGSSGSGLGLSRSDFGRGLGLSGSDFGKGGLGMSGSVLGTTLRGEIGPGMPGANMGPSRDGACENKGQAFKPEMQPTTKIDIGSLDKSFAILQASILESQLAESRLKVVEERGCGFSDELEQKAHWREAWKNKFIQEKALRAAIKQLEVALEQAWQVCYEETLPPLRQCQMKQALRTWLDVTSKRINVFIIELERGIEGD